MTWDFSNEFLQLRFDPLFTSAIASVVFILGMNLRKNLAFLRRFCVPAGVVGGLCTAFFIFSLHYTNIATVSFDQTLQMPLISIFFTRVGLTGSFQMIRRGGRGLFIFLCFCWGMTIIQNVIGVIVARFFGIHPVLGVMAGSVALEGGHNLAVIFGPMAERMGVSGAQIVAISAATYGLMAGGLLGAPVANWLIKKRGLELVSNYDALYKGYHHAEQEDEIETADFIYTMGLLLVLMAIGSWGASSIQYAIRSIESSDWRNFTFPGYLGAMLLGMIFRNLNDTFKMIRIRKKTLELISSVAVCIFLTVSMMNLKINELYGLAMPLFFILLIQTLLALFVSVYILFPVMGKDYDAAIMAAGFIGNSLGSPSSAVSMMRASCDYHNLMSYKAFLIVPLCGAALIDIVALPNILWFIKYFSG